MFKIRSDTLIINASMSSGAINLYFLLCDRSVCLFVVLQLLNGRTDLNAVFAGALHFLI